MLARHVWGETSRLLEACNTANKDQVSAANLAQVMHADASGEDDAFQVYVDLQHGRLFGDVLVGSEDVLMVCDSSVCDNDIYTTEGAFGRCEEFKLIGIGRRITVDIANGGS